MRAPASSPRIPAGTWCASACSTRSRSAPTRRAPAARSPTVGLAGFEERHPRDLSAGERERLALAAVLVTEPDLLVLDEPTRGVDPERKAELARLLRAQAPARGTLVITHDLVWAAEVADRVVTLEPGDRAGGAACVACSCSPACCSWRRSP